MRPAGGHRGQPRPAAARAERGEAHRRGAVGLPDQALADRQRGRSGHPPLRGAAAAAAARGGLRPRRRGRSAGPRPARRPGGRGRADPRGDRGRRAGRGVADLRSAHRRPCADHRRGVRCVDRRRAVRAAGRDDRGLGPGSGPAVRQRGRGDRAGRAAGGQRGGAGAAAARLRGEPGGDLPRPVAAAEPPLPGRLPLAGERFRRGRRRPPGQARVAGVAAGQERRAVGGLRHRRRAGRDAAGLPVPGERSGRGRAGQAAGARHRGGPPDPADGARRVLRRHRAP